MINKTFIDAAKKITINKKLNKIILLFLSFSIKIISKKVMTAKNNKICADLSVPCSLSL